ncbi:GNAT family N-acetyltransferase [uncultured Clostridium sp.]|uniref:GNAT family N-acetyltransferase n=1 Tax=uncultured Clostridium sp. TaxID=59620 RepID=UPI002639B902|nr:GNAT family N-acetyltransferase [uncultured Clostridium sp.]
MRIELIEENKKKFLDLLLLADEDEKMIDRYLQRGIMFALYNEELKGICIVTKEEEGIYEIKNVAIYKNEHNKGYGKKLIKYIIEYFKDDYKTIYVGTGDSPLTIPFYKSCGFKESHRIKNFFVDNYNHEIIEVGIKLVDMVYLKIDKI